MKTSTFGQGHRSPPHEAGCFWNHILFFLQESAFLPHEKSWIRFPKPLCFETALQSGLYPVHTNLINTYAVLKISGFVWTLVCYTAVFSVVTQWGGALRDDTKNGCVADYVNLALFSNCLKTGLLIVNQIREFCFSNDYSWTFLEPEYTSY